MRAIVGIRSRVAWLAAALLPAAAVATAGGPDEAFRRASASADVAEISLGKVRRWLDEVALKRIDPKTGLYKADGGWTYRDTAADCYPFLVWAAWATDPSALDGPVRRVLHAERRLCNALGRIPASYDFKAGRPRKEPLGAMIFGASEYVKDGLIAIVEVTGRDEWFDRMRAVTDDVWDRAPIETPFGRIPSTNIEVNGEQLQALARLHAMTGEAKYLRRAERIADHYLSKEDFVPRRLRDHGCEIIGGLGLLLGVESEANPKKAAAYAPRLRKMLDAILARGLNPDGLMLNGLAAEPGPREGRLSDGWGYNYVAFLCYDLVVGRPHYRPRVEAALKALAKDKYRDYPWEGRSIDGYADSIEGALYLLNRLPVAAGLAWADREMAAHVVETGRPERLWGTAKLQSNGVRTTIIHAMMHTRGLRALPWAAGLALGAAEADGGLAVVLRAADAWKGRLVFDVPRHRLLMGFKTDWPRMNTLPEWFTVDPEKSYTVRNLTTGRTDRLTGRQLHEGLPLSVAAGQEIRLRVE